VNISEDNLSGLLVRPEVALPARSGYEQRRVSCPYCVRTLNQGLFIPLQTIEDTLIS